MFLLGGSNVYSQSMFCAKIRNTSFFFLMKFSIFTAEKNLCILHIFVMCFSPNARASKNIVVASSQRR